MEKSNSEKQHSNPLITRRKVQYIIIAGAFSLVFIMTFILVSLYNDLTSPSQRYSLSDNSYISYYPSGKVRLQEWETDRYLTPKFDRIFRIFNHWSTVYENKGKRGYLNRNTGEIVIDAKTHNFSRAWEFDKKSGLAAVVDDGKLGFIDLTGSYKIAPQFTYDYNFYAEIGFRFVDGYCMFPGGNGMVGLIDTTGKIVIEPRYSLISGANSMGYRVVANKEKSLYGLYDSTFTLVLPVEYNQIELTENGIILEEANRKRLVDYNDFERVITTSVWDGIVPLYYQPAGSGEENCEQIFSGFYQVEIDDKSGMIDANGKVCIEPQWDEVNCLNPSLFKVWLGNQKFLVDAAGKYIN